MEDLTKQVANVLAHFRSAAAQEQSRMILQASSLHDELEARGFVEAPRYKLAPMDAVPPKALSAGRLRHQPAC